MKTRMVLVRMPVGLHSKLKHKAIEEETSLAWLVSMLCASKVGFKMPAEKKRGKAAEA